MAKYERIFTGDFDEILDHLETGINENSAKLDMIDKSDMELNDTRIAVRVYERYFHRNSNRASLNVTVVGYKDQVSVIAIGGAGSGGMVFNFSWGTEEELVAIVRESMELRG